MCEGSTFRGLAAQGEKGSWSKETCKQHKVLENRKTNRKSRLNCDGVIYKAGFLESGVIPDI